MCLPIKSFKIEREWEHAGLKCAVVQAREAQHRCGYVRVPPTHSLFGKDYDAVDVKAHGGLTFAQLEPCTHEDGQGWWFGFDCVHFGDAMYDPDAKLEDMTTDEAKYVLTIRDRWPEWRKDEHYWAQEEVEAETESLAEQLAAL